jgi:hypothetical protein
VYGTVHTALAIGLGIIIVSFWRSMGKTNA